LIQNYFATEETNTYYVVGEDKILILFITSFINPLLQTIFFVTMLWVQNFQCRSD